ncbi:plastocyanin/azurin family copper-binding protein [Longimicrobium sp.]|uniref:plastocyanin/azurin family copper-binding protein n=1 Tax=Longimicrobium sp. TaxID=2029185 RepID=UPI003B3B33E4
MSIRKLPILGLLALAAACGGGDNTETAETTTTDAPAASGTPTVTTTAPATPAPAAGAPVTPDAGGQVHEVKMVTTQGGASGEFQPKTLTVKKGDVIRWVMADGQAVHNVSFTMAQGNPGGFTPPADSPMYTQAGQSYEIKVDMAPGTYNYVCVPHSMMGMTGSITVQ